MKTYKTVFHITITAVMLICFFYIEACAEPLLLEATIKDVNGIAVEGAKLFLYDSSNARRPADYISAPSDKSGKLKLVVPPGTYWAVARLKMDEKFGPLMPGDKHSGEPVEIEVKPGSHLMEVFTVSDLRELGQKKSVHAAESVKVIGRVINEQGNFIPNAYVYAHATRDVEGIPDYISPWTDDTGNFMLYVPKGKKYYLGASTIFPLKSTIQTTNELNYQDSQLDIAIHMDIIVK